jgi:hypothetical protein
MTRRSPDEVFIEILSYLNGIDVVFEFLCLNDRVQYLLFEFRQIFNLKSISKSKFDFIFREHDTRQCKI